MFERERKRERERERERERMKQGGQIEKGRHRIWNRLQALSCQHIARHGAWTHELGDHGLSWSWMLNWLSHPGAPWILFLKFFLKMFIYFWERERERERAWVGEGQRERGRHRIRSSLQAELSAQSPTRGLNSRTVPCDHDLSRSQMLNWLSHPGTPFQHF